MRTIILATVIIMAATVLGISTAQSQDGGTVWAIDTAHSSVGFKIQHMGAGHCLGMFTNVTGAFTTDSAKPDDVSKWSVEAEIAVESISTGQKKRDDHLLSADFFDAEQFPTITFKSKSFKAGKEAGSCAVVGDLTMKGVTKEVTLQGTVTAPQTFGEKTIRGFSGTTTIDRTDFNITYGKTFDNGVLALGNMVEVVIEVELGKK